MVADPTQAATALLDRVPSAARAMAAAHADADHWRAGLAWAGVGIALILIQRSKLLPRLQARLTASLSRESLAAFFCAVLLVFLVEAARILGVSLADVLWSRATVWPNLLGAIGNLPIETLIGGVGLWALLAVRRRWPRFGWAGVSAVAGVLIFAAVLIPPVTLLPAARGDRPASGPNVPAILGFVRKGGLDARTLSVFDSTDPLAVDMEGVGPIDHAAVSRAALAAPRAETYAAIGHLLGHHRHHDLYGLAALWSAAFGAFCWAVWTGAGFLDRRPDRTAPPSTFDGRASPMVGLIGWGVLLLATPAFNVFDQIINYRADDYALSLTRDPEALCRWLMITEAGGKADPSPLEALFFFDHPPLKDRLVNALRWKAARPDDAPAL
jgi:Zn-dependent protease with chaperone function